MLSGETAKFYIFGLKCKDEGINTYDKKPVAYVHSFSFNFESDNKFPVVIADTFYTLKNSEDFELPFINKTECFDC